VELLTEDGELGLVQLDEVEGEHVGLNLVFHFFNFAFQRGCIQDAGG